MSTNILKSAKVREILSVPASLLLMKVGHELIVRLPVYPAKIELPTSFRRVIAEIELPGPFLICRLYE